MAATKMVFHHMVLIFHSFKGRFNNFRYVFLFFRSEFGYAGFSDLEDFWARGLPDDFQQVFQTTSSKSSDGVFSHVSFHSRSERFGFTDLGLIYMFFRSGSDFERLMGSLLGSLLKYNALEDFQEVFQTTSKKSSERLPGSLPDDFQEVF
ncbi:hypothetical protein F2Q69_00051295 [Brassica cretica]|uniref:Uncharacterized protein n=2 Tax=Brassica cretica TaxID=69181 RepID=A0A8S9PIZ3_BRACR|nr:hypothetical protein F2Q69_00051295 [Brassica cretica]KAF3545472.1 hypothetical protein DY000_02003639 [Brassica cretica]